MHALSFKVPQLLLISSHKNIARGGWSQDTGPRFRSFCKLHPCSSEKLKEMFAFLCRVERRQQIVDHKLTASKPSSNTHTHTHTHTRARTGKALALKCKAGAAASMFKWTSQGCWSEHNGPASWCGRRQPLQRLDAPGSKAANLYPDTYYSYESREEDIVRPVFWMQQNWETFRFECALFFSLSARVASFVQSFVLQQLAFELLHRAPPIVFNIVMCLSLLQLHRTWWTLLCNRIKSQYLHLRKLRAHLCDIL